MIELAPQSKVGLAIRTPIMAGSGAAGLGDAWPTGFSPDRVSALVTSPLSLHARRGASGRLAEVVGGFLLGTGDHNPGARRAMREHGETWQRLGIPVIAALSASAPEEWPRLAGQLEAGAPVAGFELHLTGDATIGQASAWVRAIRRATQLPLLAKLPSVGGVVSLGHACTDAGADALVAGSAPQGLAAGWDGAPVEGSVAGPVALPFTLRALRSLGDAELGLPVIAAGGITRLADVRQCLDLGAVAVQLRSVLWVDPATALALAAAF